MSKTAVLLSCSDHYHHRLYLWDRCLQAKGYQTKYVTSNFDHVKKDYFTCDVPNSIQLSVIPYQKNLSVARILSHRMFAKKASELLQQETPDVIVALLPPNFLGKYLSDYKKKHPNVVLLFDIFDMWPETFPSGKIKKLLAPVFSVWAGLRDKSLPYADFVTTECDLFRQMLHLSDSCSKTIYLSADAHTTPVNVNSLEKDLELCYLGSINNVISIPDICNLIAELSKSRTVKLHIIGKGEKLQELLDGAKASGAEVIYHGAVYDIDKKREIMSRCHFGLNIMKSSVCVGLTMKSVDYFSYGLPIINSIGADTERMVTRDGLGIQLDADCVSKLLEMDMQQYRKLRSNVTSNFKRYFTESTAIMQFNDVLNEVKL